MGSRLGSLGALPLARLRRMWVAALLAITTVSLAACMSGFSPGADLGAQTPQNPQASAEATESTGTAIGNGQIKVGLLLPLSAAGNAGVAAQSMRNSAELALAEFNNPNIQLLVKDDGGTPQGAQQAVQQALDEGAELIIGPLFAHTVAAAGQAAHARHIPLIAFSTDSNVASGGIYLLSFLPESDVDRIVDYAVSQNKRSFVALLPDNAYGTVVEAEFKQYVGRKGARVVAIEHYTPDDPLKMQDPARRIAQVAGRADALFIGDGGDDVPQMAQALSAAGVNLRSLQLLGTGLWEDSRIFASPALEGAWYVAPDPNLPNGFRAFSARYRTRYGQDPVRTATLSYDAVALVAALVKTQGDRRFADEVLTASSGFAGIDGVFRFRTDGTNQRGLAVLKVTPSGGQVVAPAPRSFGNSGT
jgi:branched-chain amino acid transport system substrate-binding protein